MENLDIEMAKRRFSTFLLNDFLPKCPLDLRIIPFNDFPSGESLEPFLSPGVFGIHCFATDRTYFSHNLSVVGRMSVELHELEYATSDREFYEGSSLLLEDYLKYNVDCFIFIIFCFGPEWESFEKREQKMKDIQSLWTYDFYEESEELD